MIVASFIFWFLLIGHRLVLYRIENGSCGPTSASSIYVEWDEWFEVATSAILPPVVMLIFAFLLIRSVREIIERRINPTAVDISPQAQNSNKNATLLAQMSSKLTIMLLLQSVLVVITYVPYAIELAYTSITDDWPKTPLQKAGEKIFTESTHLLSYVFFASSFYILLFTNSGFRRQFKRSFGIEKQNDLTMYQGTTLRTQTNVPIH
ncbi:unnamed protein product [Adineta ricciae]|nr:unnamed protein product [Adineta ricciae]